jgi:anti-sigma regulatory factor (Ser/Thr protein kinase)
VSPFFDKILHTHRKTRDAAEPLYPLPASADSYDANQKLAMTGWIANRLGQRLGYQKREAGKMIYAALSSEPLVSGEAQYLLHVASCLLDWIKDDKDVYMQIKNMQLQEKHHQCLLQVYEEIKEDIALYLPSPNYNRAEVHSEEDERWQVYREVIFAATHGKFQLICRDEIGPFQQGALLCEAPIEERADIPKARELAKMCLAGQGIGQADLMGQLLAISEAITNVLKHADKGKMTIVDANSSIHVLVEDSGPGFPLKLLPKATLMSGYSTKKSLGQGFTLMLKMTDQVLLSTCSTGSTLVLIFNGKKGAAS